MKAGFVIMEAGQTLVDLPVMLLALCFMIIAPYRIKRVKAEL